MQQPCVVSHSTANVSTSCQDWFQIEKRCFIPGLFTQSVRLSLRAMENFLFHPISLIFISIFEKPKLKLKYSFHINGSSLCVSFSRLCIHGKRISSSWKIKEKGNFLGKFIPNWPSAAANPDSPESKTIKSWSMDSLEKLFPKKIRIDGSSGLAEGMKFPVWREKPKIATFQSHYFWGRFHQDPWKNSRAGGN